jgi:hypothetical protein
MPIWLVGTDLRDFQSCFCLFQNKWQRAHSNETLTKSWADVCVKTSHDLPLRRSSLMPPPPVNPKQERYRTGSLVVSNQTTFLQPPSGLDFSFESGYLSLHGSSNSTPNSPKSIPIGDTMQRRMATKSVSEDNHGSVSATDDHSISGARDQRRHFYA